jgi:uncharacterized membrane protein SpoIIM required for sporulation
MIGEIQQALSLINFRIFLFSMVLFLVGYTLAPLAYYKQWKILLAYPLWIARKLDKLTQKKWTPIVLFVFILSINIISLFVDLLSGYVPGLPFFFAIWTGLNIGVVTYHTLEGRYYYLSLLNPVALLELPASFVAFSLAIEINCVRLSCPYLSLEAHSFSVYFRTFLVVVIPLLILAGIIETFAIRLAQKVEEEEQEKNREHSTPSENHEDKNQK